jgi:hypothetical protein
MLVQKKAVGFSRCKTEQHYIFNAFHTIVLDKYVYYCKPSNTTNLFAEA